MRKKGFTLIEMIVSLAIFSIVAVVALGALTKIISANKKAQALQAAFTNLNFALESMSRELRVGANYRCDPTTGSYDGVNMTSQSCAVNNNTTSVLAFRSSEIGTFTDGVTTCNLAHIYRFVRDSESKIHLQKGEQGTCGASTADVDDNGDLTTDTNNPYRDILASSNVTLEDYRLGVIDGGDYPRVFIRLIGYAGDRERERTAFDIQTTISQRIPD